MNRKTASFLAAGTIFAAALSSCHNSESATPADEPEWILAWEENFDTAPLDSNIWKRTVRGTADWQKTQSPDPRCLDMRDGLLVLRGIVNDDLAADPSPYLCGGVVTEGLKSFEPGRIEVKARLQRAKGAWPAIWLLPFDPEVRWPKGGEIDIMERLNHDTIAYQTVHSTYTYDMHQSENPRNSATGAISPDDFNVYGVDMYRDSIVFHINGVVTHSYPRVDSIAADIQFPYYQPMYLLLDMQLGGNWVGSVDPAQLPVEMEIDWVRHYTRNPKAGQ